MYGIPPPANIPGAPPNLPPPPRQARRSDLARRTGGAGAIESVPNAQRLYAWGSNKKGQLALKPSAGAEVGQATLIESLRNRNTPVAVSMGYNHTAAITCGGQLFVWGDGKHGQLGLGPRIKQSSRPYLVGSFKSTKVRMVACGRMHTLVVSLGHALLPFLLPLLLCCFDVVARLIFTFFMVFILVCMRKTQYATHTKHKNQKTKTYKNTTV